MLMMRENEKTLFSLKSSSPHPFFVAVFVIPYYAKMVTILSFLFGINFPLTLKQRNGIINQDQKMANYEGVRRNGKNEQKNSP